jgi:hypothetical protein
LGVASYNPDMVTKVIADALESKPRGTQARLAKALGVGAQAVNKWVHGQGAPDPSRWAAIEDFLELEPGTLQLAAGGPVTPKLTRDEHVAALRDAHLHMISDTAGLLTLGSLWILTGAAAWLFHWEDIAPTMGVRGDLGIEGIEAFLDWWAEQGDMKQLSQAAAAHVRETAGRRPDAHGRALFDELADDEVPPVRELFAAHRGEGDETLGDIATGKGQRPQPDPEE